MRLKYWKIVNKAIVVCDRINTIRHVTEMKKMILAMCKEFKQLHV